ncbi:hypothetical protein TWF730_000842 [Orbilia blumenaviensis]|uniref:Uncharacterized protein n=1 Tax=Orbilia blumenaviensis TaxID=1796055 RepID=A0AAV9VP27_9PEZI
MPRCHKLTYIDSRRIILRLLNNAFAEKDMLPTLGDPSITPEEREKVEQWDKEIVRLYADVAFLRRSKRSEDVILWVRYSPGHVQHVEPRPKTVAFPDATKRPKIKSHAYVFKQ